MPSWLTLRWFFVFPNEHSDLARYLLVVEFDENMRLTLRTFNSGFERTTKPSLATNITLTQVCHQQHNHSHHQSPCLRGSLPTASPGARCSYAHTAAVNPSLIPVSADHHHCNSASSFCAGSHSLAHPVLWCGESYETTASQFCDAHRNLDRFTRY